MSKMRFVQFTLASRCGQVPVSSVSGLSAADTVVDRVGDDAS